MSDLDPMPFGKYQGHLMQDVPVSYLHWLWTKNKSSENRTDLKTQNVLEYIKKNLHALQQEDDDLIW